MVFLVEYGPAVSMYKGAKRKEAPLSKRCLMALVAKRSFSACIESQQRAIFDTGAVMCAR